MNRTHILYYFLKITITGIILVISAAISFEICTRLKLETLWYLLILPLCFAAWIIFYYGCQYAIYYAIRLYALLLCTSKKKVQVVPVGVVEPSGESSNNVLREMPLTQLSRYKEIEQFHQVYKSENDQYQLQKQKEDKEKLEKALKYTRGTFKRLGFDENEIFQVCECVEYFVSHKEALSTPAIHIKKKKDVTQISLKNFAWNIGFQYNISGEPIAQFAFSTFNAWFANTTINTIEKTLKTTKGKHAVEIDEKIFG